MTSTWETDLTDDAFLGGRLHILQPRDGYRSGIDTVLLAASVPVNSGQTVLELGCGAGVALLCLGARVTGLALTGVELQPEYAALARRNATRNQIKAQVETADLRDLPQSIKAKRYDQVIANPPYYHPGHGLASNNAGRDVARAGETQLGDWLDIASRRIAPKGQLTIIQKADRLVEILRALPSDLGTIVVKPIVARVGRDADRVIVQARKGGKTPFRLCAPLILHCGEVHLSDAPDYTPEINAILRNGASLSI